MHSSRTAALGVAAALFAAASPALADRPVEDADLSEALPGSLHVGALVDLEAFLATFPELAEEGFLAEQIDELEARGVPDPREELGHLAIGTDLGKPSGVVQGVALATSSQAIVPIVRELAARDGIDLDETAYRGVTFVTGTYNQKTSRFADPTEGVILVAYDQGPGYTAANRAVDTLQGRHQSFWDRYQAKLAPGTFVTLRMTLSSAVRRSLEGTPLENMAHMTGATAEITGDASQVQLALRAKATSTFKAIIALGLLKDKLQQLADEAEDPAAKRLLLEHTEVGRSGSTLKVDSDAPRGDFVAGLVALQELLR